MCCRKFWCSRCWMLSGQREYFTYFHEWPVWRQNAVSFDHSEFDNGVCVAVWYRIYRVFAGAGAYRYRDISLDESGGIWSGGEIIPRESDWILYLYGSFLWCTDAWNNLRRYHWYYLIFCRSYSAWNRSSTLLFGDYSGAGWILWPRQKSFCVSDRSCCYVSVQWEFIFCKCQNFCGWYWAKYYGWHKGGHCRCRSCHKYWYYSGGSVGTACRQSAGQRHCILYDRASRGDQR